PMRGSTEDGKARLSQARSEVARRSTARTSLWLAVGFLGRVWYRGGGTPGRSLSWPHMTRLAAGVVVHAQATSRGRSDEEVPAALQLAAREGRRGGRARLLPAGRIDLLAHGGGPGRVRKRCSRCMEPLAARCRARGRPCSFGSSRV
ncbi:hypothetical protein Dimus_016785, partial [Dionaea muscipula]